MAIDTGDYWNIGSCAVTGDWGNQFLNWVYKLPPIEDVPTKSLSKPIFVALGHRQEAGKDTAARMLIDELNARYPHLNTIRVGFADKVKDVAYDLYKWAGIQPREFYDDDRMRPLRNVVLPKLGLTPRQVWIGIGNGVRQAVGYEGTWLDYVFNNYTCDIMVLSDLRFEPEADGVLDRDGLVYRVDCPWSPVVTDGADDKLANYTRWSGILNNSEKGNRNYLKNQVMGIVEAIESRMN